jgi:hypothetical protein
VRPVNGPRELLTVTDDAAATVDAAAPHRARVWNHRAVGEHDGAVPEIVGAARTP